MKRFLSNFPALIFLIALILRLIPVLLSFNLGIGLDDMFQYDMLARSLAAGNGYRWYAQEDLYLIEPFIQLDFSTIAEYDPRGVPTSFRPPLYPAFLALIYFVAGTGARRFFVARLVQAFVGAALAPLTYALAKRLIPPLPSGAGPGVRVEKSSRLAAWVVALYPMLVIYPLSLATENLFFLLILCSVLALLKAAGSLTVETAKPALSKVKVSTKKKHFVPFVSFVVESFKRARWFLLSGFLLGLAALTRSVALPFAGLAVLWVWFALRQKKMALVTFAMVALTVLPWMARNSLLYQRPTGIETALGYDLYVSYHPQTNGKFQYPQSLDLLPILDDMQREEIGLAKTREFILADPGRVPGLWLLRFGYFFGLERRALTYFYSNNFFGYVPTPGLLAAAAVVLLPFMAVSASAAFGLALVRWRASTWLLALLLIGYITPHILIIAEDRFHLTLVPFLAILAASFWTGGLSALRERARTRTGKIALALGVVAALLLFANWGLELWRDADKLIQLLGPGGNQAFFSY
jgi:4-amino-4-deoxy-L-arabinose transferase-like glycosyltransferase